MAAISLTEPDPWDWYCYYQYDEWEPCPTLEERKIIDFYGVQERIEIKELDRKISRHHNPFRQRP